VYIIQKLDNVVNAYKHDIKQVVYLTYSYYLYAVKVKLSLYTPWRRFGGEEV
jgi:hypothetical protein